MTIVKADPALRRKFWLAFSIFAIVGMGLALSLEPMLNEFAKGRPAVEVLSLGVKSLYALGFLGCALLLYMAYSMHRLGSRIRSGGRYPLPGMKMLQDTKLVEGAAAEKMGAELTKGGIFFGCLAIAMSIGCLYLAFRLEGMVADEERREHFRKLYRERLGPTAGAIGNNKPGAGQ